MNKIDKLAAVLKDAGEAKEKKKTEPYDTTAKVVRVEGSTAWVNIPGGVDKTPATMVVNAKTGEEVRVHVAGGKAYVTGNATSPPTDDSLAQKAENNAIRAQNAADSASRDAKTAKVSADSAVKDAGVAKESADSAVKDAARAYTAAESAQASATAANTAAQEAKTDAATANQAATNALRELSTVENVVDTLEWITAHGTMTLTTDTDIDPTHVYFVIDPNGQYVVGSTHYSIVEDPKQSELNTYYELTINDAVTNYVATHLVVDTEGLWIVPATNNANRVLIAHGNGSTYTTAGTYIVGTGGAIIGKFTIGDVTVGDTSSGHTVLSSNGMEILDGSTSLANIGSTIRLGESSSSTSRIELGSSGMDVYKGTTKVANFGDTATIGKTSGTNNNVELTSTGLLLKKGSSNYAGHIDYTSATSTQTTLIIGAGANNVNRAFMKCEFYPLAKTGEVVIQGAYETSATLTVHGGAGGTSTYINANADNFQVSGTFNGFTIAGASGTRWNLIPVVNASGVLEVGKYIDFHETGTGSEDYTARLNCSSAGTLIASGAVQATNYYVGSHTTAIGSQVRAGLGTSKSLTANTWTELFSFSLPAGTWLVIAGFRCPSSASGLRYANIEKTSKNTSQNASFTPSGNGVNSFVFTKSITVTAATTFYYNVMSTVASSASAGGIDSNGAGYGTFYQAIRLL